MSAIDYGKIFDEYTNPPSLGAVLRCFGEIAAKPLRWLWPGRIPLGKLTLLIGDPGLGKSLLTADIASRTTRGTSFPDGATCESGSVIFLSAEDDAADTIRPRLDAAGAEVSRIHALEAVRVQLTDGSTSEKAFSLETDIAHLESAFERFPGIRLIVIDPLSAYLGGTDSHSNGEIRGLLSPLAAMAARREVAVLAVTHCASRPATRYTVLSVRLPLPQPRAQCGQLRPIRPMQNGGCFWPSNRIYLLRHLGLRFV